MGVLTLLLVTATIESKQYIALGLDRPDFPDNSSGHLCQYWYDKIKELRTLSDNNGGKLSEQEQQQLDADVNYYNTNHISSAGSCRDTYGGNPRLAGDTGVVQNPGGGSRIVESGPKTPKNNDANVPPTGGGILKNDKNPTTNNKIAQGASSINHHDNSLPTNNINKPPKDGMVGS
jgi:hypothetical protein